jgi:hypothetical protein
MTKKNSAEKSETREDLIETYQAHDVDASQRMIRALGCL